MKKFSFLVLVLCFAAVSCKMLPKPEEMKADIAGFELPRLPEEGKALVYVVRPNAIGGLIRFNVFIDDKLVDSEMGFTRGNQYIYFNLQPGPHTILSKAENWAEYPVNAEPGDIIFIEQVPAMGFVMARNSLKAIEDYAGKYHVKHLAPGTIKKLDK